MLPRAEETEHQNQVAAAAAGGGAGTEGAEQYFPGMKHRVAALGSSCFLEDLRRPFPASPPGVAGIGHCFPKVVTLLALFLPRRCVVLPPLGPSRRLLLLVVALCFVSHVSLSSVSLSLIPSSEFLRNCSLSWLFLSHSWLFRSLSLCLCLLNFCFSLSLTSLTVPSHDCFSLLLPLLPSFFLLSVNFSLLSFCPFIIVFPSPFHFCLSCLWVPSGILHVNSR